VVRRVRLISGLTLFAFILGHFLNHALGLVSLGAMERSLEIFFAVWRSPPGQLALYTAFSVHFALALYALWQRRSLRLPRAEAVQYVMGFAIPLLVAQHVTLVRVNDALGGDAAYYANVVNGLWRVSPVHGWLQAATLLVAWIHAAIGLRFWLRLRPWYDRAQPYLYAAAILVPILALLGFAAAGREIAALAERDPAWLAVVTARAPPPEQRATLDEIILALRVFFLGSLAAMLAARSARRWWERRHGVVQVAYPDGQRIAITPGTSVLEASRLLGYPHASVCGGRGRCSTCRVRVRGRAESLPPASKEEARVLGRIAAAPNVRLACQLRPRGDVEVTPLLPATAQAGDGAVRPGYHQGREQEIAIMFADLRAFTRLAETKLPYDVVFLLNRYFAAMGRSIEEAGGRVDKFIGDGIMALFGLESGRDAGCREAVAAARLMSQRIDELNHALAHDLSDPLRIGIGIHTGPAIVGELGYGSAMSVTAVGDAVNTASRLEALCKDFQCELVLSEDVALRGGLDLAAAPVHEIKLRGRDAPLRVHSIGRAADASPEPLRPFVVEPAASGARA
jgi:adenylate cyclase